LRSSNSLLIIPPKPKALYVS